MKAPFSIFTFITRLLNISPLIFVFIDLPRCKADCKLLEPVTANETYLLRVIKPLTGSTFEFTDTEYVYKVGICSQVAGSEQNVGAMQYPKIHASPDKKNHSLGRIDMVDITLGTGFILLTYYGGDDYGISHCNSSARVTNILIICDPSVLKGEFRLLEERKEAHSNCFYFFQLSSNVSCSNRKADEKPSKLSSGSVFCILFFTVILVYLVCGFLYKRIVSGAKGLEQIPNYSFWRDFGNLQADGCDYFCRCGPRQESQAYRGIDDHLKMDEERDDQLLN